VPPVDPPTTKTSVEIVLDWENSEVLINKRKNNIWNLTISNQIKIVNRPHPQPLSKGEGSLTSWPELLIIYLN